MGIKFNTKPTYGDDEKYIKTKIKTQNNITTNFYQKKGCKKVPKEKIPHKCLSIIILDSILYAYEKYHPQIFLEECKYAEENIKTKNYIHKELKSNLIVIVIVIVIAIAIVMKMVILIMKNKFTKKQI